LLALPLVYQYFEKGKDVDRLQKEIRRIDGENKRLSSRLGEQGRISDSLQRRADTLLAIWQEKGRDIIIEEIRRKYREDYNAIHRADPDEQIRLLTEWLAKRRNSGR